MLRETKLNPIRPRDARAFRDPLRGSVSGASVVTSRAMGGRTRGSIIYSFASRSLDPPRLCSLSPVSSSRPVFEEAAHFLLYVLAEGHERLAPHFARSGIDALRCFNAASAGKVFRYRRAPLYDLSAVGFPGTAAVARVDQVDRFTWAPERWPPMFHAGRYAGPYRPGR